MEEGAGIGCRRDERDVHVDGNLQQRRAERRRECVATTSKAPYPTPSEPLQPKYVGGSIMFFIFKYGSWEAPEACKIRLKCREMMLISGKRTPDKYMFVIC